MLDRETTNSVCRGLFSWLTDVFDAKDGSEHEFYEDWHLCLTTAYRSLEEAMRDRGMKIPNYVEHRVSRKQADMSPEYVPCRRCEMCRRNEAGVFTCSAYMCVVDGNTFEFETSRDDGCSRGILRREYR